MDRKHYLILLLYFQIVSSYGQALSCLIHADKEIYFAKDILVNKYPVITIELKNNTDTSVNIVNSLDGSALKKRYPYTFFKIQFFGDTALKDNTGFCGNFDGIHPRAFLKIESGQSLVSDTKENILFFDYILHDKTTFERKGKYKISFHYDTSEPDFKKWMGDKFIGQQDKWFDRKTGEVLPEYKKEYEDMLVLFEKVPKTKVSSNEIVIEVK